MFVMPPRSGSGSMSEPPRERTRPAYDQGRRGSLSCRHCGSDDGDLCVDLDPLDDTIYVYCLECERDIAAAAVIEADVAATITVDEVDDLDPRLQDDVREHLDEGDK